MKTPFVQFAQFACPVGRHDHTGMPKKTFAEKSLSSNYTNYTNNSLKKPFVQSAQFACPVGRHDHAGMTKNLQPKLP